MTKGENMMHTKAEREALLAAEPVGQRPRTSHQGRKLRYEGTRFPCPHCKAASEIRTGRMVTATLRESIYQCTNVECGHTFIVDAEVSRTLSPSATPDPTVNIPLSTHVRRNMMRVVLDNSSEAEYQARYTTPVTGDLFGANTS